MLALLAIPLLASVANGAPTPCGTSGSTTVQSVRLDSTWLTPDAIYDAPRARLHVVYGSATKNAYYTYAAIDASGGLGAFSPSIQLNTAGVGVTTTMGERGPKIALGTRGALVVVWPDLWTGPGARTFGRSSTSADGSVWSAPAPLTSGVFSGIDGLSVAASPSDAALTVAFFHVNRSDLPPLNASSATLLHTVISADGGRSWGAPALAQIDGGATPAIACSMCATRPRFDGTGSDLLLAYRSAIANERSFRVLRAPASGTSLDFSSVLVNPSDNWTIDFCPMNGPELTLRSVDDLQAVAFMTSDANRAYWSLASGGGGGAFSGHVPTPLGEDNERYPTAVTSASGDVLFVWQVGPMAVTGTATVKWACYASNGTLAQSGALGTSFAGTKATALAAGPAGLLILTTAA